MAAPPAGASSRRAAWTARTRSGARARRRAPRRPVARPPARGRPHRLDRRARHPRPPPRRTRRNVLAVPPIPVRRRRAARSTGAARPAPIISMCASANGKPRTRLAVARPVAVDELQKPSRAGDQARPRARAHAGRRRAAGAQRRARRAAGLTHADGQPQGARPSIAEAIAAQRRRAGADREACRRRRGSAAFRAPSCSAISSIPIDSHPRARRSARRSRRRRAISCRCSIRPRKRCPTRAAPNSSGSKGGERWIADRAESLRDALSGQLCSAPRRACRDRDSGSAGRSWSITPTARHPSRCCRSSCASKATDGGYRWQPASCRRAGRRAMSFGALAFLNPWLLAALAALPLIYWLLRTVPPRPAAGRVSRRRASSSASRTRKRRRPRRRGGCCSSACSPPRSSSSRSPSPSSIRRAKLSLEGTGPVVIVVDNGWAAAPALGGTRMA